ncbi:MAG TPA: HAD domain-containing protein [Pseudonocardiaceae bacterium]|jgi:hypothetical protein
MAEQALLLLDVDGVLNPYAAKPTARPLGYRTYRHTPDGGWYSGSNVRRHRGLRIWLHPAHGARLRELAAKANLELAWATTWMHDANTYVGPAIGLRDLPVIEFPATDLAPVPPGWFRWTENGGWKWPAVAAYAAGRPLAWLDDEHDASGFPAARAEFDRNREGIPTLLCHVDPRKGLLPEHLHRVADWAADLHG